MPIIFLFINDEVNMYTSIKNGKNNGINNNVLLLVISDLKKPILYYNNII